MIIGLEGVSCTGKTTLAAAVAKELGGIPVIGCYYHCAPDPSWLPDPHAATGDGQLNNLRMLLRIEELRYQRATAVYGDVILDRSVDTLLAHTHAIGQLQGFNVDSEAWELVRASSIAVPEVTLLLQAQAGTVEARAKQRVNMPTIYYDRDFTRHFNAYFEGKPFAHRVVKVSTDVSLEQSLFRARTSIALCRNTEASVSSYLSGVS